ncbi:hypothetical protein HF325_006862 [Metschnikowia pulcherrima]|uniref:Uncharacterized protein n=1 Tax=Metschnikowia pulcherrima TaxID=27326 RepID=A0A8H7LB78_9ASCO|nr:hypothetical protein HF325_006862 [Metschnikowia pulcherrima]
MPLDIIRKVDVEDAERYKIGFRSYIRDDEIGKHPDHKITDVKLTLEKERQKRVNEMIVFTRLSKN